MSPDPPNASFDTTTPIPGAQVPAQPSQAVKTAFFVAIFVLVWITLTPFPNLGDPWLLRVDEQGSSLNQIGFSIAGLCALLLLWPLRARLIEALRHPVYIAFAAWLVLTCLTSSMPLLSLRRLAFSAVMGLLALAVLTLPRSVRHFVFLLAGIASAVLVLSYLGILLVPELSVHQLSDVKEPELAGGWRGLYAHKNEAAPMMVMMVFLALLLSRMGAILWAVPLGLGSLVFLWGTEGKTATILLPTVLLISWLYPRLKPRTLRFAVVLVPLIALSVATLGSVYSDAMARVTAPVTSGVTFTGRNEIWQFGLAQAADRPLLGYGIGAFWMTEATVFGMSPEEEPSRPIDESVSGAAHGHNAYLDLALASGVPGLILGLLWLIGVPLMDIEAYGMRSPLAVFFFQVWLFVLYLCCLESILLAAANPLWFMVLVAMFGLRLARTIDFEASDPMQNGARRDRLASNVG